MRWVELGFYPCVPTVAVATSLKSSLMAQKRLLCRYQARDPWVSVDCHHQHVQEKLAFLRLRSNENTLRIGFQRV